MELPCPSCRAPLAVPPRFGGEVSGCRACGGLWLSNRASQCVVRGTLDFAVVELAQRVDAHREPKRQAGYRDAAPSGRRCPHCATPLQKAFVTRNRIEVDVCSAHGTWFDRFELRTILQQLAIELEEAKDGAKRQALIDAGQSMKPGFIDFILDEGHVR
ncbi:MAG: zf-TFIIB domain-containing protein [Myxococcota bacterium]